MPPMRICYALAAAIALSASAECQTLRYTILFSGHKQGTEVDTYKASEIDSAYEFNDRGRGPKITSHYVLSPDTLPIKVEITGNDYLKAPVEERFATANGTATWKSTSEHGSAPAGAFYVSNSGPYAENALLVQAVLKHGGSMKLYPAGEARVEKLADITVQDHGESRHVTEYAITGLGFTPSAIWLDDDLHFFANPGTWGAALREGWEGVNDQLYKLQLQADDERFRSIAKQMTKHPEHAVAIEHVRLFDSEKARMIEDQTVVVSADRITAVGPAASIKVPADADRVDGRGKTLLPGLFDMHVHVGALDGILNIASGVTTVRDMGNNIDELARLDKQWQSGDAIGPRVFKAGLIDGKDPMQSPTGLFASTQEEANAAVDRYADLGYVQTKLYSSIKPEWVPGIIAESHKRGMRVSGHVPNGLTAEKFVRMGADELQHINFIFLNFFADRVKDTRTPERFTAVGQYAATLDLNSQPVDDFIALLKQHHTTVDVTLATFESMFTGRPGEASPDFAPVLARMPAQVQRGAYGGGLPVISDANAPNSDQRYRDSYANMLKMTKRLFDAGVPVLAGTDALAGIMLHRELELEVKAGIPPVRALQNATYLAAQTLKQQDSGVVRTGARADLLMIEGDPSQQISDIRRTRLVFKNGAIFDPNKLYPAISIQPAP